MLDLPPATSATKATKAGARSASTATSQRQRGEFQVEPWPRTTATKLNEVSFAIGCTFSTSERADDDRATEERPAAATNMGKDA